MSVGSWYQDLERLLDEWNPHWNRSISSLGYSKLRVGGANSRFSVINTIASAVNSLIGILSRGVGVDIGGIGVAITGAITGTDSIESSVNTINDKINSIKTQYDNLKDQVLQTKDILEGKKPEHTAPNWQPLTENGLDYCTGWSSHDDLLATVNVEVDETVTEQIYLFIQNLWQLTTDIKLEVENIEQQVEDLASGSASLHDTMVGIKSVLTSIDNLVALAFAALRPKANFSSIITAILRIGLLGQILVWLKALLDELAEVEETIDLAYNTAEDVGNVVKNFSAKLGV